MLNPSPKSRFMEKFNRFSRILAGLVGYKISPLENKKRSKNKKSLKTRFYKNNKKVKNVSYTYASQHFFTLLAYCTSLHFCRHSPSQTPHVCIVALEISQFRAASVIIPVV